MKAVTKEAGGWSYEEVRSVTIVTVGPAGNSCLGLLRGRG